jgi:hypothetical protein
MQIDTHIIGVYEGFTFEHLLNLSVYCTLTSVDNPVPGNQEFCFNHLQTTLGQVKKIRSPTWGIV